ncbi:UbiA family prenyltransferase [Candidatus Chloroploca sp. M-50]|uniref:UbiA family prenyltransferase n=1 Tax=Candidatus Chloroploca mongolica TaxID=2528176 RepID=A0ABS4DA59_9CHLR|nr:UbiA family prenyltransferase [Candidatus Chloroploca mongolica]
MVASGVRQQLIGLFEVTRFTNSLYAGMYTLVGAYLSGGIVALWSGAAWVSAVIVGLVVAFGFVINDMVDVEVDRLAKPHRPLVAGRLSQADARIFALVLASLALGLALVLGWLPMALVATTLALATFYSFVLKGTVLLGNVCMGVLIALIPLFGALAGGGITLAVWVVAGLMFLFDVSHEVLKTTADHEGDRAAGLTTVATYAGVPGAIRIFQLLALLFCLVALLPWPLGLASWAYALALVPCALLPTLFVIVLLLRSTSDETITLSLKIMRYMWITNLLPILLLSSRS